jgi:protein-S-isoprenylcysteine O-methyltransferase Ste14
MNAWHVTALVAALGTMACFAGALPLYFRKGTAATTGKRVMVGGIVACGLAQAAILFIADNVAVGWRIARLVLLALAHALFWSAVASHWGSGRPLVAFATDAPGRFIRRGPYRWIRHPFYMPYILAWLAGLAAIGEQAAFLSSTFSGQYRVYQQQTGMYFPRLFTVSSTVEPLSSIWPEQTSSGTGSI